MARCGRAPAETLRPGVDHLEILQQLAHVAARREVALYHARPVGFHHVAVGVAAGEAFGDARGVDARLLAQADGFAEHRMTDADDQLVDHLRRQPRADRSHARAAAGDVRHQRRDALEVFGGERRGLQEIVVEAVLDGGADGDPDLGEELLHRLRHDVRGRVAQGGQGLGEAVEFPGQLEMTIFFGLGHSSYSFVRQKSITRTLAR